MNGKISCVRLQIQNFCSICEHREELKQASDDLILHEPPLWPETTWNSLERYSTVQLAVERFKNYCAMLQSSPELLSNNYNTILVTKYALTCLNKVISNRPLE